ncbi:efflux transporter outer membrane subunit [Alcaligenes faecalis]|uniref:efflux transporter outer membrane subunit n=1 Tax=Alcaligenes faecalis TaxID=511 RepID=UPI0029332DC1|nr:efflux transporter outer membrane subunit [Alcaligenes faecalis]MDV2117816.1 efflux transporter outer membrane subunit [Alcaligenes faecalis]
MAHYRWIAGIMSTLLLQACSSLSSDLDKTPPTLPQAYQQRAKATPSPVQAQVEPQWWRAYNSPALNSLMQEAVKDVAVLRQAQARILQAQAQARIAGASLLPELQGNVSVQRDAPFSSSHGDPRSQYVAGVFMSYELDVWGRNRALADSAVFLAQAANYELDVLRVSVQAQVVHLSLQALGDKQRVAIARQNLAVAQRLLSLLEARLQAGAASPLELAQQRQLLASQQRKLFVIEEQAIRTRVELATLLGRTEIMPEPQEDIADLQVPELDAGLPAQLLSQRPDIARIEAQLSAAHADVQVARAAMYPSLTLGARAGASGNHWEESLRHPVYSLISGLVAPIFNAGRLQAGKDLSDARLQEWLVQYRQTIVQAYMDVEGVLAQLHSLDAQAQAMEREWEQARLAFQLAEARYRSGSETLLSLLDAQRTLYAAQDVRVSLMQSRLQSRAALFRALGGGWQAGSGGLADQGTVAQAGV